MNRGWHYLTAERMKMHTWTRKRRLKFRKRWRAQHNGHNFYWFISEFKYIPLSPEMMALHPLILHAREP